MFRSVLDTTTIPNGTYSLQVAAMDTRHNVGSATIELHTANLVAAP